MTTELSDARLDLSPADLAILRGVAAQLPPLENVTNAGSKCKTEKTAKARIARLLKKTAARAYLRGLLARAESRAEQAAYLTIDEKRRFLARSLRTSPAGLDPEDPLVQEYRLSESESDKGSSRTEVIKIISKKDAIELDNKLAGHTHPDERPSDVSDELTSILAGLADLARTPLPNDKM